jgi:hypothetical protein
MNMIKTLATKVLATLSMVALMSAPATATGLDEADMAFALGDKALKSARGMTVPEMEATEGAALPPVFLALAIGAVARKITQEMAVSIARNNTTGVFIHASTRQQAQQIAKAASGGNNAGIRREIHTPTARNPVQYNHFHPTNSKAHITWGKSR